MHRFSLAILVLAALSSGCCHCCHWVRHKPFYVWHMWADWNTLGEPALFCERIEHLPYESYRVGRYRWMYGINPGLAGDEGVIPIAGPPHAMPMEWPADPAGPGVPISPHGPATLHPLPPEELPSEVAPMPVPNGGDVPPVPPPAPVPPSANRRGSLLRPAAPFAMRSKGAWLWQSAGRDSSTPAAR